MSFGKLFWNLERFNLPVSEDNKLFKNLAIFDVQFLVSLSPNLIDEPIFVYNKEPQNLIIDFVTKLELLAEQN